MDNHWCLLTGEGRREPHQAAPLPAGMGREEAPAALGDHTGPRAAGALLALCCQGSEASSSGSKSCGGVRGGGGGAMKGADW